MPRSATRSARLIARARLVAVRACRTGRGDASAAETGIVTERDVLRALAAARRDALDLPVGQIHEPAARRRSGRRLRLSRHRPHEPARRPPSRRRRRGRPRGRRAVGARSAAAARRGGRLARRRDRSGARMCTGLARAWAKLPRVAARCSRKDCPAATSRR